MPLSDTGMMQEGSKRHVHSKSLSFRGPDNSLIIESKSHQKPLPTTVRKAYKIHQEIDNKWVSDEKKIQDVRM
jgi:hypothetical protein